MKVLTLSFLLFPLVLCAQFSKGDKYATASFHFSADNVNGDNPLRDSDYSFTRYFGMTPGIGYFIGNNLAIGIQASYSQSRQRLPGNDFVRDGKYNSHSFSVAPFVRRYWALSDKFLFSITASTFYTRNVSKVVSLADSPRTQYYVLSANLSSSFSFFPTKHWAIETRIAGISGGFNKRLGHDVHSNYFSFGYGSINLGIAYYFIK